MQVAAGRYLNEIFNVKALVNNKKKFIVDTPRS